MDEDYVMVPLEFCAIMPNDILCPMCDGYAFLKMEGWTSKKPCPICKGVGQLNEFHVPSKQRMVQMVLAMTPASDREKVIQALTEQ